MQQDVRFMIEAVPGKPLNVSVAGGTAINDDALFTLVLGDGLASAEVAMQGETALAIARGIVNSLARAGMDMSRVSSTAGDFLPPKTPDA